MTTSETPEILHAEATDTTGDTVTVTTEAAAPLLAAATRTVSGTVVPWDTFGRTSNGPLRFAAGGLRVPTDITRVKLLAGHSPSGVPVGHATGWKSTPEGLVMTFSLGTSAAADAALVDLDDRTVDAFSVEATITERDGTTITEGVLNAVALVPTPAFADARVATVQASIGTDSTDGDGSEPGDQHRPEPTTSTTPTPAPGDGDDDSDNPDDSDDHEDDDMHKKNRLHPGTLPGATTTAPATPKAATLAEVTAALGASVTGAPDAESMMTAALVDITDANTVERSAPAWLGELWSGVTYTREIIPLVTQAPLTSRKVRGYRWATKPKVASYTGNKAEIPSFPVAFETVERDAERWAGGNDLDRIFWDFGESEFLASYWRAMSESYAYETDKAMGDYLVTNAAAIDGGADNIIDAVLRGSNTIRHDLHQPASFVLVNPDDYLGILTMTMMDKPVYMDRVPHLDPANWTESEFVPSGTIVLGTKNAATHYELSGSPLRVEAEHIALGGRDAALFGYTAKMINRAEGLRSITFDATAPVPAPEG
ncbi:hypothetical protein [Corynebacterium kalidii]